MSVGIRHFESCVLPFDRGGRAAMASAGCECQRPEFVANIVDVWGLTEQLDLVHHLLGGQMKNPSTEATKVAALPSSPTFAPYLQRALEEWKADPM